MCAAGGLEDAGDHSPEGAAYGSDEQGEGHVDDPRQAGDPVADGAGEQGADDELSLSADVEQAGLEGEGDGEAAHHEGGGLLQGASDALAVGECAVEQGPVGLEGVQPG